MIRSAIGWLASDRALLVAGTSLVLGGLVYVWVDCLWLWRVRRSMRDAVDLASTTAFTAIIGSVAVIVRTYDSVTALAAGVALGTLSFLCVRRALRLDVRRV
jgi:hypothetical protein